MWPMVTIEQIVEAEFQSLSPNYFNAAYFGPSPARAQKAGQQAIARSSNPHGFSYDEWRPIPDQLRSKIAGLLGVSPENISHHAGISEIIATISLGFPFKDGDSVVSMNGDFPSDVIPWM